MDNYRESSQAEETNIHYALMENNIIVTFYNKDFHGEEEIKRVIKKPHLLVNEELWQYLLSLGQAEFIGEIEDRTYTIEDGEMFSKVVIPPIDLGVQPPTDASRIQAIEDMLKELI